jgi:uncharacterized protein YegL
MQGDRIAKLNQAIPVTVEALKGVIDGNPNLRIVIKAIEFSNEVSLVSGQNGQEIENFQWRDLTAGGGTSTASAIKMLCEHLDLEMMPKRGYPPVVVLVSDGYCTELSAEYNDAIAQLNKAPWGRKAARIVVSIGDDIDEDALRQFVNKNGSYINCEDAEQIVDYIKIKTTEATLTSSETVQKDTSGESGEDNSQEESEPGKVDTNIPW